MTTPSEMQAMLARQGLTWTLTRRARGIWLTGLRASKDIPSVWLYAGESMADAIAATLACLREKERLQDEARTSS